MVTSMLLDGQIAWRHHGLMQIKSAEMAGLNPSQENKGVLLAVENSMPDLNLEPWTGSSEYLAQVAWRSRSKCSVLAIDRQRRQCGLTS